MRSAVESLRSPHGRARLVKLISCKGCGTVLNSKVLFREVTESHRYGDDGSINEECFAWSHSKDDYVPKCNCPVCNGVILKE